MIAVRAEHLPDSAQEFREPMKGAGSGAGYGAAAGATGVARGCLSGGSGGVFALLCLALVPVGAVTGAIVGAGTAHSTTSVEQATSSLKSAIAAAEPAAGIARVVVEKMRGAGDARYTVSSISEDEEALSSEALAERGIDAALELRSRGPDLVVFGKLNPDAALSLTVHGHLQGTRNGAPSVPFSWAYLGERHDYFDLAADDALLLRDELRKGYEKIAEMIVAEFFHQSRPRQARHRRPAILQTAAGP